MFKTLKEQKLNLNKNSHCLWENAFLAWTELRQEQRWYFRKLMATGSLFLGIDSSGGIDSVMKIDASPESIPPERKFLCGTLRNIEKAHVLDEKSIPASKIEVHGQ
jgi:hypothetical protein